MSRLSLTIFFLLLITVMIGGYLLGQKNINNEGFVPGVSRVIPSMEPPAPSPTICPPQEYVDCQPGPGETKRECTSEYLEWALKSCAGFRGAAL